MDKLRDAIVARLKAKFPYMEESIRPSAALLDEQSEGQVSYPAPAILVSVLPVQEAPDELPWELRCNFGLVVTVKKPRAIERDAEGWKVAIQAGQVVYRNMWGFNGLVMTPAVITSIGKNEARDPSGTPTGVNYWTVVFYNYAMFEALV